MRQKLYVTLAVAVIALSGARETCKQFNGLRSLAGEWSGVWNTMLVYAGAYAEGVDSRPARTLIASTNDSRRGESATAGRSRRTRARVVRQTPRAERDDETAELRIDLEALAFGFAAKPEATATGKVPQPRLRVNANADEIADALAGAFHSDFDAEMLKSLTAGREIEIPRSLMSEELIKRGREGVVRKTARAERVRAGSRGKYRFVFGLPEAPRVSAEAPREAEAAVETRPVPRAGGGPEGVEEDEVLFVVPQSSSGLLNCEALPRR